MPVTGTKSIGRRAAIQPASPRAVLHGGPGSGCSAGWRQYFDPDVYRIVLFDQRGCGRSTPHASDPNVDLSTNTTAHLLADIELLLRHLGIERWLVLGGSWGSTLALAYAEQHRTHVTEMVLFSVATTTPREIDWITRGVGVFFPEPWARFRDGIPEAERNGSLVEAYHRLLMVKRPPKATDKRILSDELVVLKNKDSRANYPKPMRRIRALVEVYGKKREMECLTNNVQWSAGSVADLYRCRWQIEVFFKQIKQSLQLCDFHRQQRQRGALADLDGVVALRPDAFFSA